MGPWSIALVSDFFHPKIGGVESHIYLLAQTLMARGHRVVVVTHAHPPFRYGVRYLTLGLKVYYLPLRLIPPSELHATLPNLFLAFPLLRQVFIREQVQIVHAHAALSNLGLEAILHARTMRIKAVFTDHSLLGLGGFGEVWGNKMLRACLSDVDGVLCVSKACRDNTSVRAHLDPSTVHVIPSAVVASDFTPIPQPTRGQAITIVCMSRLVYRKGIDLLIGAIPSICARYPRVRFLIGGDGPKMVELEQMRQRYQALLADRVELLGPVRHELVRHVLRQGQIFLNTALTEAFGIGILEAACCGLYVVSTRVGGVPEVLPDDLIELAEPNVHDVIRAICAAVDHMEAGRHSPDAAHQRVKALYTWDDITTRVEAVYAQALARPMPDYFARFEKYSACGPVFGKIMCLVIAVDWLFLMLLEWVWPARNVDLVPPLKRERLEEVIKNKTV